MPGLVISQKGDERRWPAKREIDPCLVRIRQRRQDHLVIGTTDELRYHCRSAIPRHCCQRHPDRFGSQIHPDREHSHTLCPSAISTRWHRLKHIVLRQYDRCTLRGRCAEYTSTWCVARRAATGAPAASVARGVSVRVMPGLRNQTFPRQDCLTCRPPGARRRRFTCPGEPSASPLSGGSWSGGKAKQTRPTFSA